MLRCECLSQRDIASCKDTETILSSHKLISQINLAIPDPAAGLLPALHADRHAVVSGMG